MALASLDWMDAALCTRPTADPKLWTSKQKADREAARAICALCRVRSDCEAFHERAADGWSKTARATVQPTAAVLPIMRRAKRRTFAVVDVLPGSYDAVRTDAQSYADWR